MYKPLGRTTVGHVLKTRAVVTLSLSSVVFRIRFVRVHRVGRSPVVALRRAVRCTGGTMSRRVPSEDVRNVTDKTLFNNTHDGGTVFSFTITMHRVN